MYFALRSNTYMAFLDNIPLIFIKCLCVKAFIYITSFEFKSFIFNK